MAGLWRGLGQRIVMIGTLTALQWLIYDSFKGKQIFFFFKNILDCVTCMCSYLLISLFSLRRLAHHRSLNIIAMLSNNCMMPLSYRDFPILMYIFQIEYCVFVRSLASIQYNKATTSKNKRLIVLYCKRIFQFGIVRKKKVIYYMA